MQRRLSSRIFKLEQQDWLVIVVLVLSCILLLISHFLAVRSINQPRLSPTIVQESFTGNDRLRSLERHLLEVESNLKDLIITGEDNFAQNAEAGLRSAKEDVVALRTILGRFDDAVLLSRFEELVDEKMRYNKNILDSYRNEGMVSAEILLKTRNGFYLMDSIFTISGNLREIHSSQIKGYLGAKSINNIWLKRFNWFSILTIFMIVPFTIFYLIRAIRKREAAEESRAEKQFELDQQFSFIKDLYRNAPVGYHSISEDGTVIEMNDTELKWLGYQREEVIGKKKLIDLIPADAGALVEEINQKLIREGGFDSLQLHMLCRNGSLFEVLMSSRPTFDDAGHLLYSRSAVMDYSERKKLEDDLENARKAAEKSAILKEQFVANISHEIRTPLNAILGFSNLLQRTDLEEDQIEFASNIQVSSENLMAIINDILDFSKIEAGMLHLDRIPFSLPALLHSIRNLFQLKASEKKLGFQIQIAKDLPANLIGDPTRLTQILVNLLGNAFK
ncbi:MAG: PAS domain S-box protein, partial [Saprospiraceae bacterium]|nr:PAS domain S-box protein [Saprospiraceae bacterium]